jgi:hypothetical protein
MLRGSKILMPASLMYEREEVTGNSDRLTRVCATRGALNGIAEGPCRQTVHSFSKPARQECQDARRPLDIPKALGRRKELAQ